MFECRIKCNEYPEVGELVVVKAISSENGIMTVSLIEYGNIVGTVFEGDLSRKKYKEIQKMCRAGSLEVCQVTNVDKEKGHIDLNMRKVEDKQECMKMYLKNKLAYQIMGRVSKSTNISLPDLYSGFGYKMTKKYGTLYRYLLHIRNTENLEDVPEGRDGECLKRLLDEEFKPGSFKVRMDVDVTGGLDGVECIRSGFLRCKDADGELDIRLLKSPTYTITRISENKDAAFQSVTTAGQTVEKYILEHGGSCSVVSPPKVYGLKSKHSQFESEFIKDVD
jgi:translation initiation factor 2 subunit 1